MTLIRRTVGRDHKYNKNKEIILGSRKEFGLEINA